MKEVGRSSQNQERSSEAMLAEARDRLTRCRELFILSSVMLLSGTLKSDKEKFLWCNIWFNASSEEEQVTRELIAPAKLKTGAFRTVPAVEDRVRTNAANFVEKAFVLEPEGAFLLATAIVNPHIKFTKVIQKEERVAENPLFISIRKKTNPSKTVGGKRRLKVLVC